MILFLSAERIHCILVKQIALDELRRLKIKLTSRCYPLLESSDPDMMRGSDYHSQKVVIIYPYLNHFLECAMLTKEWGEFVDLGNLLSVSSCKA